MPDELKGLNREDAKEAVKDAIKEWMDERFQALGRWTFGAFMAALFGALVYLTLTANGWQHK